MALKRKYLFTFRYLHSLSTEDGILCLAIWLLLAVMHEAERKQLDFHKLGKLWRAGNGREAIGSQNKLTEPEVKIK